MEDLINEVKLSYFQWVPLNRLEDKLSTFLRDLSYEKIENFQKDLIDGIFGLDIAKQLPVLGSFHQRFIKKLILILEDLNLEVSDEIYHLLVDNQYSNEHSYKTYFLKHDLPISLSETNQIITSGTTGLRTWEAAIYLLQWLGKYPEELEGKQVLELGSGLGYVGIGLLKLHLKLKQIVMSDCHEEVIKCLQHNCQVNELPNDKFQVINLNWHLFECNYAKEIQPDILIGSDIVFDPSILVDLVNTIRICLETTARKALIACTIRNQQTLDQFQQEIRKQKLTICDKSDKDISTDNNVILFEIMLE